jgi:hypothetical protein
VNARIACKWAIGVFAIVVLTGVGAVVLLFVAGFISPKKGEQHRRQLQAELDSGKWDSGDQPALFVVAQGIVKNDQEAIPCGGEGRARFASARTRWCNAAQLRCETIVAATGISRRS